MVGRENRRLAPCRSHFGTRFSDEGKEPPDLLSVAPLGGSPLASRRFITISIVTGVVPSYDFVFSWSSELKKPVLENPKRVSVSATLIDV